MNDQHDAYLSRLYYTAKSPASYSGPYKMWIHIKNKNDLPEGLSYKKVKEWYQSQVTHNIHIIPRKKFAREPIIVDHMNEQMDCDLIDAARLKKYNSGFGYILVCCDLFSRYVWVLPLLSDRIVEKNSSLSILKLFLKTMVYIIYLPTDNIRRRTQNAQIVLSKNVFISICTSIRH